MCIRDRCEHFGFTERPADTMMTLFAANGWVVNVGGVFQTTEVTGEFLCAGPVWDVRPYFASLHDLSLIHI